MPLPVGCQRLPPAVGNRGTRVSPIPCRWGASGSHQRLGTGEPGFPHAPACGGASGSHQRLGTGEPGFPHTPACGGASRSQQRLGTGEPGFPQPPACGGASRSQQRLGTGETGFSLTPLLRGAFEQTRSPESFRVLPGVPVMLGVQPVSQSAHQGKLIEPAVAILPELSEGAGASPFVD